MGVSGLKIYKKEETSREKGYWLKLLDVLLLKAGQGDQVSPAFMVGDERFDHVLRWTRFQVCVYV